MPVGKQLYSHGVATDATDKCVLQPKGLGLEGRARDFSQPTAEKRRKQHTE